MNRFQPLLATRFPHFGYIHGGGGGSLILDRCRAFDLFASVKRTLCCHAVHGPSHLSPVLHSSRVSTLSLSQEVHWLLRGSRSGYLSVCVEERTLVHVLSRRCDLFLTQPLGRYIGERLSVHVLSRRRDPASCMNR